jgi:CRP-like cAMP-binding protein
MATVRCVRKTHLIVLTKEAFDSVIGKMERRILNDKINFLRNIPVFTLLTKNSLAKITCSLGRNKILKDQYLYKEGDAAKSVFIVIKGEFEVIKTIVYYNKIEESVDSIFKDPLKANKKSNLMFAKNVSPKH